MPAPELTPAGVRRVIPRLRSDLAKVNASGAPQELKDNTAKVVSELVDVLTIAADDPPEQTGQWVILLIPRFDRLTNNLREALNLGEGLTGACIYFVPNVGNRCIQCTRDQCTDLGGAFSPDTPCPPQ